MIRHDTKCAIVLSSPSFATIMLKTRSTVSVSSFPKTSNCLQTTRNTNSTNGLDRFPDDFENYYNHACVSCADRGAAESKHTNTLPNVSGRNSKHYWNTCPYERTGKKTEET